MKEGKEGRSPHRGRRTHSPSSARTLQHGVSSEISQHEAFPIGVKAQGRDKTPHRPNAESSQLSAFQRHKQRKQKRALRTKPQRRSNENSRRGNDAKPGGGGEPPGGAEGIPPPQPVLRDRSAIRCASCGVLIGQISFAQTPLPPLHSHTVPPTDLTAAQHRAAHSRTPPTQPNPTQPPPPPPAGCSRFLHG